MFSDTPLSTDWQSRALNESRKRRDEEKRNRLASLESIRLEFKESLRQLGIVAEPKISLNGYTIFEQLIIDEIEFAYRTEGKQKTACNLCSGASGYYSYTCEGGLHAKIQTADQFTKINNLADLGILIERRNEIQSYAKKKKSKWKTFLGIK